MKHLPQEILTPGEEKILANELDNTALAAQLKNWEREYKRLEGKVNVMASCAKTRQSSLLFISCIYISFSPPVSVSVKLIQFKERTILLSCIRLP